MVPWLRPRRMRDVSVVMIAEAMMRAISSTSAKPERLLARRWSQAFEAPNGRGRLSGAFEPAERSPAGGRAAAALTLSEASDTSEISEVELCTSDDPSRVRLVFPVAHAGGHVPAVRRVENGPGPRRRQRLMSLPGFFCRLRARLRTRERRLGRSAAPEDTTHSSASERAQDESRPILKPTGCRDLLLALEPRRRRGGPADAAR